MADTLISIPVVKTARQDIAVEIAAFSILTEFMGWNQPMRFLIYADGRIKTRKGTHNVRLANLQERLKKDGVSAEVVENTKWFGLLRQTYLEVTILPDPPK